MGDTPSIDIISKSDIASGYGRAGRLNPELVVLSGDLAQSNDILLASVRESRTAAHPLATRDLRITRSQMGARPLIGAGHIAVEALFEMRTMRQWVDLGSPLLHPSFAEKADNTLRKHAGRDEEEHESDCFRS